MTDINRVTLVGEIVGDIDYRRTVHGTAICQFGLGVRGQLAGETEMIHFFDVVVWGKQAEKYASELISGMRVAVDGRLEQLRWVSPSGYNRSKVEIRAEKLEMLDAPTHTLAADEEADFELFPAVLEGALF